jgi:SAM-dependent methyltransferase
MSKVYNIVVSDPSKQKVLDIPAGNGLLAQKIEEKGHTVVRADINEEEKHFVYADMSEPLPFNGEEFDTVICLEGLEHLINPAKLIEEFCRVVKPGGRIIISLPNIQNMYSRFHFLCTGTFFQFPPLLPSDVTKTEKVDLGHVASLSYIQLRYLFKCFDADLIDISGDKYKKKILLPFLSFFILIGYFWIGKKQQLNLKGATYDSDKKNLMQRNLLFSRSLILVFQKEKA